MNEEDKKLEEKLTKLKNEFMLRIELDVWDSYTEDLFNTINNIVN